MNRSLLIKLHLYAAAFLAPAFLFVAISGGLYLIGIKGSVEKTDVGLSAGAALNLSSKTLYEDVQDLLAESGISHDFEYVKVRGNTLVTRPTSRAYYQFDVKADMLVASYNEPSLQKSLIELHKGHGPGVFKTFQKILSLGLIFVVLSGFWLGVSSLGLRRNTLIVTGLGTALFGLLIFL